MEVEAIVVEDVAVVLGEEVVDALDVRVEIDDVEATDEAGLTAAIDATPIGEALELTIVRGRRSGTVTVVVAER